MRKQETEEQENRRKEELKQVRLRQQLDMYYKGKDVTNTSTQLYQQHTQPVYAIEVASFFLLCYWVLMKKGGWYSYVVIIGVTTGGARGQSATPDSEKFAKNREKARKFGKKEEKSGRKGKNLEDSFTLPLLTNRTGYATGCHLQSWKKMFTHFVWFRRKSDVDPNHVVRSLVRSSPNIVWLGWEELW